MVRRPLGAERGGTRSGDLREGIEYGATLKRVQPPRDSRGPDLRRAALSGCDLRARNQASNSREASEETGPSLASGSCVAQGDLCPLAPLRQRPEARWTLAPANEGEGWLARRPQSWRLSRSHGVGARPRRSRRSPGSAPVPTSGATRHVGFGRDKRKDGGHTWGDGRWAPSTPATSSDDCPAPATPYLCPLLSSRPSPGSTVSLFLGSGPPDGPRSAVGSSGWGDRAPPLIVGPTPSLISLSPPHPLRVTVEGTPAAPLATRYLAGTLYQRGDAGWRRPFLLPTGRADAHEETTCVRPKRPRCFQDRTLWESCPPFSRRSPSVEEGTGGRMIPDALRSGTTTILPSFIFIITTDMNL